MIIFMNMEGICETGPTVYRPYPRRLESRDHRRLSMSKTKALEIQSNPVPLLDLYFYYSTNRFHAAVRLFSKRVGLKSLPVLDFKSHCFTAA